MNSAAAEKGVRRLFLAQCSSIGSLGATREVWLLAQFLSSLQGGKDLGLARLCLIYPSVEDVRNSLEGYSAGDSLPYQESTAKKQPWLRDMVCKWRSEGRGRSKAMPHTYTEIWDGIPQWLLVTSANLSKAAWGDYQVDKLAEKFDANAFIAEKYNALISANNSEENNNMKSWLATVSSLDLEHISRFLDFISENFSSKVPRIVYEKMAFVATEWTSPLALDSSLIPMLLNLLPVDFCSPSTTSAVIRPCASALPAVSRAYSEQSDN
ncbi:unnamed protein product [Cylicocyclus nassatus]|uniref:Tyrosyl-DNA phosphodiesterase 1 n=1 Tax=Cylicocyclus nassatus TaxID=53992 RepID=A0AA36HB32_CYLNA|nr:unnamed protein product [Cylicocyclus nassatus]